MQELCECCRTYITEDEAGRPEKLCSDCRRAWRQIPDLAPSYKLHVLAAAICPDKEEVCKRLGCTPSAHQSGVGNATIRTRVARQELLAVARWAIDTNRVAAPEAFAGYVRPLAPPATNRRTPLRLPAAPATQAPPVPDEGFDVMLSRFQEAKCELDRAQEEAEKALAEFERTGELLLKAGRREEV